MQFSCSFSHKIVCKFWGNAAMTITSWYKTNTSYRHEVISIMVCISYILSDKTCMDTVVIVDRPQYAQTVIVPYRFEIAWQWKSMRPLWKISLEWSVVQWDSGNVVGLCGAVQECNNDELHMGADECCTPRWLVRYVWTTRVATASTPCCATSVSG